MQRGKDLLRFPGGKQWEWKQLRTEFWANGRKVRRFGHSSLEILCYIGSAVVSISLMVDLVQFDARIVQKSAIN